MSAHAGIVFAPGLIVQPVCGREPDTVAEGEYALNLSGKRTAAGEGTLESRTNPTPKV